MIRRKFRALVGLCGGGLLALNAGVGSAQPPSPEPTPAAIRPDQRPDIGSPATRTDLESTAAIDTESEEGVDYLTRGPLHEAFADPFAMDPKPNPVVNGEPPEPINEIPPEYQPQGKNVQWIPGYWSWDDERNDFLWVSGVWRDLPPDRRWVPGYWERAASGHRWVSGFWQQSGTRELAYYPDPPSSVERGPSAPSPGDDYFYIPGNWVYQSEDYQWQPGYWARSQPGWVWVPSQYYWTPRGCVYRAGYWDYDIADRGMVFTPVYYQRNVYTQPNYRYRPRFALDTTAAILVNLFLRPNYGGYYFGDYYGSRYNNAYLPWVNYGRRSNYYDPLFAYYSARQGNGGTQVLDWVNRRHNVFANNQQYRPPRTVAAQRDFLRSNLRGASDVDAGVLRTAAVAESLTNLVNDNDAPMKLRRLDSGKLNDFSRDLRSSLRDIEKKRRDFEIAVDGAVNASAAVDSDRNSNDGNGNTGSGPARGRSNGRFSLPDAASIPRLEVSGAEGSAADRGPRGRSDRRPSDRPNRGPNDQSANATGNATRDVNPLRGDGNPDPKTMQDRVNQLRREGGIRPQRPSDWPSVQPRGERPTNRPELPRRGNQGRGNQGGGNQGNAIDLPGNGAAPGTPSGNRGGPKIPSPGPSSTPGGASVGGDDLPSGPGGNKKPKSGSAGRSNRGASGTPAATGRAGGKPGGGKSSGSGGNGKSKGKGKK